MSQTDRLCVFRQHLPLFMSLCYTHIQSDMISVTAEAKQINVTTLRLLLSLCFCDFVLDVCSNAETLQSATTRTLCRCQRVAAAGAKNRLHGKASNY